MNNFENIFMKKFLPFLLIVAAIVIGGVAVRAQSGNGTSPDGDGGSNIPAGGFSRGSFLTPPCALGEPNCVVWTGLTANEDLLREFDGVSSYGLPVDGSLLFVKQDEGNTFSLLSSTGSGLNWFDDLFAGPGTSFVGSESQMSVTVEESEGGKVKSVNATAYASDGNQVRYDLDFGIDSIADFSLNLLGGKTNQSRWYPGQTLRVILCNIDSMNLPLPADINWLPYDFDGGGQINLIWPGGIKPVLPVVDTCTLYSFFASADSESTGTTGVIFGSYVENFQ